MNPTPATDRFQALDACHQQIHLHLEKLASVLVQIEAYADESKYRQQVGEIEAFFSGTSRQHHAEEEKNIFPGLLASDNAELAGHGHGTSEPPVRHRDTHPSLDDDGLTEGGCGGHDRASRSLELTRT